MAYHTQIRYKKHVIKMHRVLKNVFAAEINPPFLCRYSCTKLGTLYQIDYQKIVLEKVIRLLPVGSHRELPGKYGGSTPTQFGIGINALSFHESFCVTGSDDGFLRLWSLDFSSIFLEAGMTWVRSKMSTL